jgi:hypothetical protein
MAPHRTNQRHGLLCAERLSKLASPKPLGAGRSFAVGAAWVVPKGHTRRNSPGHQRRTLSARRN